LVIIEPYLFSETATATATATATSAADEEQIIICDPTDSLLSENECIPYSFSETETAIATSNVTAND